MAKLAACVTEKIKADKSRHWKLPLQARGADFRPSKAAYFKFDTLLDLYDEDRVYHAVAIDSGVAQDNGREVQCFRGLVLVRKLSANRRSYERYGFFTL
jgi:hypothetical protein